MTMEIDPNVIEIIAAFSKINTEVPEKTRAALTELNHLDDAVRKKLQEAQKTKLQFMANYEKMTQDQRAKAFNLLQEEIEKIAEMCDKKVGIATEMRDAVYEAHQKFKTQHAKFIENYKPPKTPEPEKSEKSTPRRRLEVQEEPAAPESTNSEKKRGRKKREVEVKIEEPEEEEAEIVEDEEEQKMYCWCQLEKQDNMVFCENPACEFEWFHFSCISMVTAPKDDWYCSTACRQAVGITGKKASSSGTPKRGGARRRK